MKNIPVFIKGQLLPFMVRWLPVSIALAFFFFIFHHKVSLLLLYSAIYFSIGIIIFIYQHCKKEKQKQKVIYKYSLKKDLPIRIKGSPYVLIKDSDTVIQIINSLTNDSETKIPFDFSLIVKLKENKYEFYMKPELTLTDFIELYKLLTDSSEDESPFKISFVTKTKEKEFEIAPDYKEILHELLSKLLESLGCKYELCLSQDNYIYWNILNSNNEIIYQTYLAYDSEYEEILENFQVAND